MRRHPRIVCCLLVWAAIALPMHGKASGRFPGGAPQQWIAEAEVYMRFELWAAAAGTYEMALRNRSPIHLEERDWYRWAFALEKAGARDRALKVYEGFRDGVFSRDTTYAPLALVRRAD